MGEHPEVYTVSALSKKLEGFAVVFRKRLHSLSFEELVGYIDELDIIRSKIPSNLDGGKVEKLHKLLDKAEASIIDLQLKQRYEQFEGMGKVAIKLSETFRTAASLLNYLGVVWATEYVAHGLVTA